MHPGILLSQARTIEADYAALERHGSRELAGVTAMMDDTLKSLRDLLAAFPIVRQIEEAERLLGPWYAIIEPASDFEITDEMMGVVAQPEPAVKGPFREFMSSTKVEFVKGLRLYFLPFTVLLRNLPIEIRKLLRAPLPG